LKIVIIVAVATNGVIGRTNGEMPWHVKEDFQHFKKTTMGFPIIMGRKSFESLGKPLKGRENIIVTRNANLNYDFDDVTIVLSLNEAIEYCKLLNKKKSFITGGGEIYKQSISLAHEMIISHMKFEAEGEVKFPEIDMNEWYIDSTDDREQFEIKIYKKKI
jgi:dihydrofolate reductase